MPRACVLTEYGPPDVLRWKDVPRPEPSASQVRIKVRVSGVGPTDLKIRRGDLDGAFPLPEPAVLGFETAGVVDAIGSGVGGVAVGDEVAAWLPSLGGYGEYALASAWTPKPPQVSWNDAGALPASAEAAVGVLRQLGVTEGETLLILGAGGSVGMIATQLAVRQGLRVIGAVGERDDTLTRELGATPVRYEGNLLSNVREVADRVDATFDAAGQGGLRDAITLTGGPERVITLADEHAARFGVRLSVPTPERAPDGVDIGMRLLASGELRLRSQQSLPMSVAAEAHRLLEEGHAHRKLLLTTSPPGREMTTTPIQWSVSSAKPRRPVGSRRHRRAFWVVAFAFLVVMALGTVPSPLYGLYRARDHFSLFMVTVAFAVYAVGVIVALLLAGHLSDFYGRRRVLLRAVCISIVSAIVFVGSKSLPGLLTARFINGISIGIVASTATAYLAELHALGRPRATAQQGQLTASAVNVGGLAVGALVAGLLAQWVARPLTVPYLVFLAALVLGAVGVALSPETREAPTPRPRYRPQRLSVPPADRGRYFAAALSTFVAFAANGLVAGLAGLFLAVTLHQPSLALAGGVVGAMFAAAVAAQLLTVGWSVTRALQAGMAAMVIGIGLAVLAVWLHSPSLALFIAGGVIIGAGSGAIFKGAVGTVMSISPPERIAESLTGVFLAAYVGISLPVVGAGITLARDVTPRITILGFGIAITVGIAAAAITLLRRPKTHAAVEPAAATPAKDAPDGTPGRDPIPN